MTVDPCSTDPIGRGANGAPVVDGDFREPSQMPGADHGRTHDMNAVGGNDQRHGGMIPGMPSWQDQPRESFDLQSNPELPQTVLQRRASGASDNDWDDATGRG